MLIPEFNRYLHKHMDFYKEVATNCAKHNYAKLGYVLINFPVPYKIGKVQVLQLEKLEFKSPLIHPTAGKWLMKCEEQFGLETNFHNIEFNANDGKPPVFYNRVMGKTLTSYNLECDIIQYIKSNCVYKINKGNIKDFADTLFISDTKVTSQLDTHGAWDEQWKVQACGEIFNLDLNFIPDGSGGVFFIHPL